MQIESTKENILYVAEKLFSNKGYDAVGVQEIVDASGITKPTLYYYFGNKIGLLKSIAETKGSKLIEEISISTKYDNDFFSSLTETLKAFINFAMKNPDFFRFHCTLLNAPKDSEPYNVYKIVPEKIHNLILELFIKATNIFGNMKNKEELYSTLFHNNATSIAMSATKKDIIIDEKTIYTIIHSFIYGFAD